MSKDEITRLEALVGRALAEIERLARCCAEANARLSELQTRLASRPDAPPNGHAIAWTERRTKIVEDLRSVMADLRGE